MLLLASGADPYPSFSQVLERAVDSFEIVAETDRFHYCTGPVFVGSHNHHHQTHLHIAEDPAVPGCLLRQL